MMFTASSEAISLNLTDVSFLVVEDHEFTRRLLMAVLHALGGAEIVSADNGAAAVALLRSFTPDVVITDCWMSPVGGIALTRYLRAHPASPDPFVPIIMMTADTRPSSVRTAWNAGVSELLVKPFWPRALYDRICKVILHPRPFIRTDGYFGPDRRRREARSDRYGAVNCYLNGAADVPLSSVACHGAISAAPRGLL